MASHGACKNAGIAPMRCGLDMEPSAAALAKLGESIHIDAVDRRTDEMAAPDLELAPASDLIPRKCKFDGLPCLGGLACLCSERVFP